ncbi:hypothetical protein LEP1GSC186_2927 [Leptospira noguchii serovar Autumnalis str. ZUN142]|uniref:Uncharacterized protein n=1 Tax=Leptospira noguchii serovar Autumnalis str. ZUN142 TaxID=1085540 RepID=M6U2X0_9LEPT|nr:hypothetical protein LEP1GSC186_2927 [Leptospira noguchii serovar Autumnalis str. ZUN142]
MNSASHSPWIVRETQRLTLHGSFDRSRWKLKHNAHYESRWKLKHNAHYGSRWKLNTTLTTDRVGNSTQRSLRIALETQHNAHYGSRWKLNTTLTTDRVVGGNSVLQRICRNSHRFILRSKYLWGCYEFVGATTFYLRQINAKGIDAR